MIVFLILLTIAIVVIVYYFRKKAKERVDRFARENGLNNDSHVINQNGEYDYGGSGFVDGMIVGEMLSHNHHDHHHESYDDNYHNDTTNSNWEN